MTVAFLLDGPQIWPVEGLTLDIAWVCTASSVHSIRRTLHTHQTNPMLPTFLIWTLIICLCFQILDFRICLFLSAKIRSLMGCWRAVAPAGLPFFVPSHVSPIAKSSFKWLHSSQVSSTWHASQDNSRPHASVLATDFPKRVDDFRPPDFFKTVVTIFAVTRFVWW